MTPYHLLDQIQDLYLGLQFLKNWLLHTCKTSFYAPLLHSCYPPGILMSVLFFFSFLVFVYCYFICLEYSSPCSSRASYFSRFSFSFSSSEKPSLTALLNCHTNTYPPFHLIAAACFFFRLLTAIFKGLFCQLYVSCQLDWSLKTYLWNKWRRVGAISNLIAVSQNLA